MANVRFDTDARNVFGTERVRYVLDEVMSLTIKSLEYIGKYYSQRKFSKCMLMISAIVYSFAVQDVFS